MSTSSFDLPFAAIDGTDRSGLLWITAALSLTYFVLSCMLRVFISFRSFHRDAAMLILASVSIPGLSSLFLLRHTLGSS